MTQQNFNTDHQVFSNNDLRCTSCSKKMDGAIGDKNAPADGNIAICAYCAQPMIYVGHGKNISLRSLTDAELENIKEEDPVSYAIIRHNIDYIKTDPYGLHK